MIARTVVALISLWISNQFAAVAQDIMFVPAFGGRILADGRPVNWAVEVRLEGEDSSLIATAYTRGSSEFSFRNVLLPHYSSYFLVVREPGYKELRYRLNLDDFNKDNANWVKADSSPESTQRDSKPVVYHYTGIITLNIEKEGKESQKPVTGAKAVEADQLKNQIPEKARREYNMALENISAGKSEDVLKHLEKAVELAPKYYDAVVKLGVEYLKAGQYPKAEATLDQACALNPNDPLPLTNLGTLYFQQGEKLASAAAGSEGAEPEAAKAFYRKAVDVLEKAQRLDAVTPRTNLYFGAALYKVGDYERAESLLVNALALDGQLHEARLTLINLYVRQERYDDALKQITAYLQANPDSPQRQQLEKIKTQIESATDQ